MSENFKEKYKNKRISAIDFGSKRCGIAVCDEFHITTKPVSVLDFSSELFWDYLTKILNIERVSAIVIGVPHRLDEQKTEVIKQIEEFIVQLKEKTDLEIFTFDESFSSKRATATMLEIGTKKKKRRQKGISDKIAACIILKDFLNEMEN